jgi:hypothetical protein
MPRSGTGSALKPMRIRNTASVCYTFFGVYTTQANGLIPGNRNGIFSLAHTQNYQVGLIPREQEWQYFLWRIHNTGKWAHPVGTGMAYFLAYTTLPSGLIPREQEWQYFLWHIHNTGKWAHPPGTGMAYFFGAYTTIASGLIPGNRNGIFSLAHTQRWQVGSSPGNRNGIFSLAHTQHWQVGSSPGNRNGIFSLA